MPVLKYTDSMKNITMEFTDLYHPLIENPFGYENSLMAHIRRIREKIEQNPSHPVSLITVKGLGYKLVLKETI